MSGKPSKTTLPSVTEANYQKWCDQYAILARRLGIPDSITQQIDPDKLKERERDAYYRLQEQVAASIEGPLYSIARGSGQPDDFDPYLMKERLEKYYRPTFVFNDMSYRRQLYNLRPKDFPSMTEFSNKIVEIVARVNGIEDEKQTKYGIKPSYLTERDMMTVLVSSLDKEYDSEVKAVEKDPKMTYPQAFEEVRGREVKIGRTDKSSAELNFIEKKGRQDKTCNACRKKGLKSFKGHDESTCWRKHPELKPEWIKKKEKNEKSGKKTKPKEEVEIDAIGLFSLQFTPDLAEVLLPAKPVFPRLPDAQLVKTIEALQIQSEPPILVLDSGCSGHIFGKCFSKYLYNIREDVDIPIKLPDGAELRCTKRADFKGAVSTPEGPVSMEIQNILYQPDLTRGLLSVKRLVGEGYKVTFDTKGGNITSRGGETTIRFPLHARHQLYMAQMIPPSVEANSAGQAPALPPSKTVTSLYELHCSLGHLNFKALKGALRNHKLSGASEDLCKTAVEICRICKQHKIKRKNTNRKASESSKAKEPMYRTHGDTVTCLPRTFGGKTGFSFLIDEKSKRIDVKLITHKDEYRDHFKEYHGRAKMLGKKLHVMRTDSAKELFEEKNFKKWLTENGIRQEASAPHAQYQNGFCERHIGTILRMANCALQMSGLSISFWGEAILWAVETWNRLPNKALEWKSPREFLIGVRTDVSFLHPFGCEAYARKPEKMQKKFREKSDHCILLGYDRERKAYRMLRLQDNGIVFRSPDDTDFYNLSFPKGEEIEYREYHPNLPFSQIQPVYGPFDDGMLRKALPPNQPYRTPEPPGTPPLIIRKEPRLEDGYDSLPQREEGHQFQPIGFDPRTSGSFIKEVTENPKIGLRSGRKHTIGTIELNMVELRDAIGNIHEDFDASDEGAQTYLTETSQEGLPRSTYEAKGHPEAWKAAQDEINQLKEMKTWHLVPPEDVPHGIKPYQPLMRWTRKFDGSIKARMCFRGDKQVEGRDYKETESPTTHMASWRAMLAYAQYRKAKTLHIDVKGAYLYGELNVDDHIYMQQPKGFEDPEHPDWICKLDKSLYGLKQAGYIWNQKINKALLDLGLKRNIYEPCQYYTFKEDGSWMILSLFVDDNGITGSDNMLEEIQKYLAGNYTIKVLGPITRFLGVNIQLMKDGSYHLNQVEEIEKLLNRFGLENAKAVEIPGTTGATYTEMTEGNLYNETTYRSAVGGLAWIALATRPDILAAVNICSQFQSKPTKRMWGSVKKILRYLKGTKDESLVIDCGGSFELSSYSDSSHGDPILNRSSLSGAVHFLGKAPVFWTSRKQKTPAHSTAESELVAGSATARDSLWLLNMLEPYGVKGPVIIHIDNQATIRIAESQGLIRSVKHLEIQDLFLRAMEERGRVILQFIPTEENPADLMTKAIYKVPLFQKLRRMVGMRRGVGA